MSNNRFVLVGLMASLVLVMASAVRAGPWIEAGDARMRQDIELLAAYGLIDGPVTMWPLPWAQVSRSLSALPNRALPAHVEAALSRVRAAMPRARDYRRINYEAGVAATNRATLVRGFDAGAREDVAVFGSAEKHWGSSYAKLSIGWRDDQPGEDFHFDNSYFAQALGNWVIYGGTLDQWWGGGWDAGMILSNNARPYPRVGIQRLDPRPFDTKWLSWLGNWNLSVSVGKLDSGKTRTDFDGPLVAHIRLTLQPIERLDLSFSRAIQLCGEGRPCGFSIWKDALIGFGDRDNTGTPNEPGNQLAGADLRYSFTAGKLAWGLYIETIAEDENQPIVDKYSLLFGATVDGWSERLGLRWRLRGEASDTKAGNIFGIGGDRIFGVTFSNFIFTDGFEFLNRTIGHTLSGDSRLYTGELSATDEAARHYWLRYRRAVINVGNRPSNEVSLNREQINLIESGMTAPIGMGEARVEVRLMDDRPNTPGRNDFDAQIEASWRFRF
ncbi:MAG: capsule assembly Wzi family protein [Rhodothalassiaceae bacterium]